MFALAHFAEKTQVFFNRTVTVGGVLARFRESAAVSVHLFRGLLVHIGKARLYQMFGAVIHPLEVVARKVEVILVAVLPVKTQPLDRFFDGVHVFLVFLDGVGVVKAHVAVAAVVTGKTEIQADALGVTDVQVAVRFRRKAGTDAGRVFNTGSGLFAVGGGVTAPQTRAIGVAGQVFVNNVSNKVGDLCTVFFVFRRGHMIVSK